MLIIIIFSINQMINNKNAESLIWIIIWIFILAIVILWISNLLINNKINLSEIDNELNELLLKQNSYSILEKINTDWIIESEKFYIYKDINNNKIEVFTWSANIGYKFIDLYWNKINDISSYEWKVYSRTYNINYYINEYTWKKIKKINLELIKIK